MIPFLLPILLQTVQTVPADSGEVHLRNIRQLTFGGQNAEAYFSRSGRQIILQRTEADSGCDQEFVMNVDGTGLHRVSSGKGRTTLGYDGGPFFSPDGKQIVYRAWHPQTATDSSDYRALIAQNLVRPVRMDIWVMDADGSHQRQVTNLGGASFAPYFHPNGKRIIFASNYKNPRSRNFDLYLVNNDGSGLEQITTSPEFDAFPMFSPDGKQLVWASNRNGKVQGETNIFIADWVEAP